MKSIILISLCFFVGAPHVSFADDLTKIQINTSIHSSLEFLRKTQYSKKSDYYEPGEWRVVMKSYLFPSLVGLGRSFSRSTEEPTTFATASIMNLLSESYLRDPDLKDVPEMLNKGLNSFSRYREKEIFYYYPMVEFKDVRIHVPADPRYVPRSMISLALVPADADTTAVSHLAMAFHQQILNPTKIFTYKVPEETLSTFREFRDTNRDPHIYNKLDGVKNSGAYLTWFQDENDGPSKTLFQSINKDYKHGYRIVFGANDVDCVVNANILRLLTLTKNTHLDGYKESCELLNQSILTTVSGFSSQIKYCGLYYPNSFGALYSISNVYQAGAKCLERSRDKAIQIIFEGQNEDGSWVNDKGIGREDRIQSTASAISALLNYLDVSDRKYERVIERGIRYLISAQQLSEEGDKYWEGEVFFSAGPAARNTILWRSDAYTTALALSALVKSKSYLFHKVGP
jgi:hypothetical protein